MATSLKNLNEHSSQNIQEITEKRFAIVVAEWNSEITDALCTGAVQKLKNLGAQDKNIEIRYVPGSFELSLGSQWMAEKRDIDAVIALGCVIQGETKHFDYICDAVANGITSVGLKYSKPVIFGVLTTDNEQQARDRAGGKHGNKGDEAAVTAVKMLNFI